MPLRKAKLVRVFDQGDLVVSFAVERRRQTQTNISSPPRKPELAEIQKTFQFFCRLKKFRVQASACQCRNDTTSGLNSGLLAISRTNYKRAFSLLLRMPIILPFRVMTIGVNMYVIPAKPARAAPPIARTSNETIAIPQFSALSSIV